MTAQTLPICLRRFALATGLTAAFAVSNAIGLETIVPGEGAAPIWLANGFLAAAMLLLPRRWAVGVILACIAIEFVLGFERGPPSMKSLLLTTMLAGVNILEAGAAAILARKACGPGVRLTNLRRVVRLLALAVAPAAAISAVAAGVVMLVFLGRDFIMTTTSWFIADGLGLGLILPAVLLARGSRRDAQRSIYEHVAIYGVLIAICAAAYVIEGTSVYLMLFPAAMLTAFRLGPRGTGLAMLLLTALVFGTILTELAPMYGRHMPLVQQVREAQLLIGAIFLTSLTAAFAFNDQIRLRRMWANRSALARRAQARAQSAGRAKTEFLATMSHEIRTPMNSILGFTQVLRRRDDLPAAAQAQLALIDQAGASLVAVVNDILDYSKMEAGEIDLTPHPSTPRGLAETAAAIVADAAREKGLDLTVDVSGPVDEPVLVDDLRVRQILLNLLGNAVKFTKTGEVRLAVEVAAQGETHRRLRFSVTDTGVGIDPEKLDRLFKRFSQADGSVSRAYGGAGLGLAICKGLVDRMGGDIGVESTPGAGSKFWVELPVPMVQAPAAEAPVAQAADLTGSRVLLVDDHPVNRELGAMVLSLLGCEAVLADSGEAAIAEVSAHRFDAVLMDLHMPRMDGWEAAGAIVALGGEAARTPVIALSADVLPEAVDRCRRAGMVDLAAKPISIEALHDVLSRWVGLAPDGSPREGEAVENRVPSAENAH